MAKIIEARVLQKIDTEQNWNTNELILYKGEIALVGDPDRVYNIKIGNGVKKFRDLPYMVDYVNGLYTGVVTPQSQVPSGVNNVFLVSEQGTYTNFGGVVLPKDNIGIIYKNGNNFTIQLIPIVSEEKLQEYIDEKLVDINVGFGGEISTLNQSPNVQGMYIPKASGVYPNFGNLEYDPIEGFTLFLYKDSQFSKVVVPLNPVEGDVNFNNNVLGVSGSAVEKYAIKKINTIADLRNTQGEYKGQVVEITESKIPMRYVWVTERLVGDSINVINIIIGELYIGSWKLISQDVDTSLLVDNDIVELLSLKNNIVESEINGKTIKFKPQVDFSPKNNTLNLVQYDVSESKFFKKINPDWFIGSDADKLEEAYRMCLEMKASAIHIDRDYYLDRTVVFQGGGVHITGEGFPNFFPNENTQNNSVSRKFTDNMNCSRIIANSNSIDKLIHIKGANYGGRWSACSVWIEGISFCPNTDDSNITRNVCDGIYIDTFGAPTRPFNITKCNFYGLRYGINIDTLNTTSGDSSTGVGAMNINFNNFYSNIFAVKAQGLSAVLNFDFSNNNAEQNLQGALDLYDDTSSRVLNANINITNNMLEGQPLPIRIKASKSVITIENNYFESVNKQTIEIQGNSVHTQVLFGKYFVTNDDKLELKLSFLTYTITSRIFNKSTVVNATNCTELRNNNIGYGSENKIISSIDFNDLVVEEPLRRLTLTRNYQYEGKLGTTNGQIVNDVNALQNSITSLNLIQGQQYLISFVVKDLTPKQNYSLSRKFRLYNTTNSSAYTGLDSYSLMTPNNSNEYIVFVVFTHNFPTGTQSINLRFLDYDSTFDSDSVVSRVGVFDYTDKFRKIAPELDKLSVEPTFTNAKQGYVYFNTTSNKLRVWKNDTFIDLEPQVITT